LFIVGSFQTKIEKSTLVMGLAHQASAFIEKGLTGYDACYAALAKELGGVWLTFDEKAHQRIKTSRVSHALLKRLPKDWVQ
jgi:predicted nucleic acid-binding protein